jgi:DNA-binding LacI/PurR family transcriptional regulator
LKDIAEASGFSIRTVSRALKGIGYVNEATRTRVLEAAGKIGYQPNRFARSLRTKKSYEISAVALSIDELHMAKIAAMEQILRQSGYVVNLIFGLQSNDGQEKTDFLNEVLSHRPAGVALFGGFGVDLKRYTDQIEQSGAQYIVFDTREKDVDSVRIDRQQGVYDAVHYLAKKGKRRIAYLGQQHDRSRLDGYERAIAELSLEKILVQPFLDAKDENLKWRQAARTLAEMNPRPDAIQAYSDTVALSFLAGLHDCGLRVPEDVALVGFDGRSMAEFASPPMTTVAQPNAEVGQKAAEILLKKIAGEPTPPEGWSVNVPSRLVVRESA